MKAAVAKVASFSPNNGGSALNSFGDVLFAGGSGRQALSTGGGGGGSNLPQTPGSGGSGVVVVKAIQNAVSTTGSPSNPSTGIYIFNNTGSITF